MSAGLQEALALAIVGFAALYLVMKISGRPARRRKTPKVVLGDRLARGVQKRSKRDPKT